jgi:hypothetical protein
VRVGLISLESFYDHSLALDYLVAYTSLQPDLREAVEFKVFVEGEGRNGRDLVCKLREFQPDLVGFNTYVWNIEASVAMARKLKQELSTGCARS